MGNSNIPQNNEITKPTRIEQLQNHSFNKNDQKQIRLPTINKDKEIKNNSSMSTLISYQFLQSTQFFQNQGKMNKIQTQTEGKVKMRMTSQKKQCSLTCSSIIIQNKLAIIDNQSPNKLQIEAPFEIVIITCSKMLRESIRILGHQIVQKFIDKSSNFFTPWKLHPRGFYINYIATNVASIITFDKFYQGELIYSEGKVLPSGKGIVINQRGKYTGQFLNGNAHGKGKWFDRFQKAAYSGNWVNGQLEKGQIDSSRYSFTGVFLNSIANGLGQISFKQSKTFYKGGFRDGLYDTIGFDKAYYQSQRHIYQGDFLQGKKHNYGVFREKERDYKKNKEKYCSHLRLEGVWQKDLLIEQKIQKQIDIKRTSKTTSKSYKKQQDIFMEKNKTKVQKIQQNQQIPFSTLKAEQKNSIIEFANSQDNYQA